MSAQQQQGSSSSGMSPCSGGAANPSGLENPPCPTCQRRMVIRQVAPVLLASGLDDIVYGCEKCGTEIKRTVKRT